MYFEITMQNIEFYGEFKLEVKACVDSRML